MNEATQKASQITMPEIALESVLAREEREKRRLINIIILLIVCWMITAVG